MKYLRLRYDGEDDTEYDSIVIFARDYKNEKVKNAMRELWNKDKSINVEMWLNANNLKVKDIITFNDIDVMYIK